MKTYCFFFSISLVLILCGCGRPQVNTPSPRTIVQAPDDVHLFLQTMRILPFSQRTAYANEHQDIAQKALQSTDPEVKKLVEEIKY